MRSLQVKLSRMGVVAGVVLLIVFFAVACEDLDGAATTAGEDATTESSPATTEGAPETTTTLEVSSTEVSTTEAPTTTAAPPTTALPTTTLPPAVTVTTEALSSAEERLPSGNIKAMGYIDDVWVDGGVRYLRIDYAEMLCGAEADAAAIADGVISPGEHVDNDYYITNVNPMLREFRISDSVAITTSTRWVPGEDMGAPCTWADFLSFWGPGPFPESETWLHSRPWWIERDGNTIVKIDEQYLP